MKPLAWILTATVALAQSGRYQIAPFGELPNGMEWGAVSSVAFHNGHIFALRRAAPNVVEMTPDGRVVKSWGDNSLYSVAHSIDFDSDGNIWTTDSADHVVYKFSPEGQLLLTLGKRKTAGDDQSTDLFNRPSDVAFAPNGDVYVTDGYANSRIVKFDKNGKFLEIIGGVKGSGPGEFNLPHAIVFDSKGRMLIADRENERIVILDQDGKFLGEWKGLSKPSGLAIAPDDTLYVGDVDASSVTIAKDGKVLQVVSGFGRAHNLAIDPAGNIYTAEPGSRSLKKAARQQ
jgi:DNA-binding beta-propeller fold protein YncE